jgi:hypothetical protein
MSGKSEKTTTQGIKDMAREVGQTVAEKLGQAADWMKKETNPNCASREPESARKPLGFANVNEIKPGMDVISSCGCLIGTVDHLEGGDVKLTRKDSPDGLHHFIPTMWIARVDDRVYLNKDAAETRHNWRTDAPFCATTA